jgi:histidine ammonia-lyase
VHEATVEIDRAIDARAENPRYADGGVVHHGAFNLTSLALRLDTLRLALTQWASTSVARTVKLNDPAYTGQRPFLAHGPDGSSGVMVLEYTAGSALETVRTLADPSSRHTVTISIGTEDHASFATRSAVAALDTVAALRTVLACELITAVRALRATATYIGQPARDALAACDALPTDTADRPLIDDLSIATDLLPRLASLAIA